MVKRHKELARKMRVYRSLIFRELHGNNGFKDSLVKVAVADPILHARLLKVEDNCKCKLVGDPYFSEFLKSFGAKAGDLYFDKLTELMGSGFKLDATDNGKENTKDGTGEAEGNL